MAFKRGLDLHLCLERSRQYKQGGNMNLISATQAPPTRRPKGSVVVKLSVSVPDAAFDPAKIPAILADIPLEMLQPALDDIEVDVVDANE